MDNLLNLIELRSARRARVHEALLEILEESSRRSPRFRSFPGNNSQRWYNIMVPQMDDEEFRKHFRMGRGTFTYIVEKVRPCLEREMTRFQDSLCVEKIVAIGIYVLSTNCEMKIIASLFGVGKTSVWRCFHEFVAAVNDVLLPIHIKLPSSSELKQISDDYEWRYCFPMAIGSIDGTHIPVRAPLEQAADYYNYKGWHSTLTLAICDSKYRVYWLKSGLPGRSNDSGAFQDTLFHEMINTNFLPNETKLIEGIHIPYYLLGDSAFRLSSWLIKPYPASDDDDKTYFNSKHTLARRTIECTFGRCKGRWRRLLYCLHLDIANVPSVVNAAFVLNNICEENSEPMDSNWTRQAIELEDSFGSGFNSNSIRGREPETDGQQIRNALMNFLISHQ